MEQQTSLLARSTATSPSFYGSTACRGILVLIFAMVIIAPQYTQAQCYGVQNVTMMTAQVQEISAAPGPLYSFIGGGCATAVFGPNPPTMCMTYKAIPPVFFTARLRAVWSSSADNVTANGCTFVCPGGTCRVRGGDALPVELLDFSVDGSDDPEPAEDPEVDGDSEP